jgi:Leucine-rich repeat (LRR) protein
MKLYLSLGLVSFVLQLLVSNSLSLFNNSKLDTACCIVFALKLYNQYGYCDPSSEVIVDPCDWYFLGHGSLMKGFQCSADRNITSFDTKLEDTEGGGHIPSCIGSLQHLEYLSLLRNNLVSSIPPEIGNLLSLKYLFLNENSLTSTIPSSLGNLLQLEVLDVSHNSLSGSLPVSIQNLPNLVTLTVMNNKMHSSIPSFLGKISSLQVLRLSNNCFF